MQPIVEVDAADRVAIPRRLHIPCLDTSPEFFGRYVEVVQFDTDAKTASDGSHLVTFTLRPKPEIEDDAQAKAQDLLRDTPELMVDLLPGRRVPRAGAECDEPFILREAQGAAVRSQLPCECCLPCSGQSAGEKQSGVAHRDSHSHAAPRCRTISARSGSRGRVPIDSYLARDAPS